MFCGWEQVSKEQALDLLLRLKEFFSNKDVWIPWPLALDFNGLETEPLSLTASKWCLMGACELIASQQYPKPLSDFISCAVREYLNELSFDDSFIKHFLSYDDEYALICLAIENLQNS